MDAFGHCIAKLGAVPEALRDALRALPGEQMGMALAFFNQEKGKHTGQHAIVLEVEKGAAEGEEVQIVLKLDFDAATWKRVRKKVRK